MEGDHALARVSVTRVIVSAAVRIIRVGTPGGGEVFETWETDDIAGDAVY